VCATRLKLRKVNECEPLVPDHALDVHVPPRLLRRRVREHREHHQGCVTPTVLTAVLATVLVIVSAPSSLLATVLTTGLIIVLATVLETVLTTVLTTVITTVLTTVSTTVLATVLTGGVTVRCWTEVGKAEQGRFALVRRCRLIR